jgi:upstream activation factor subunit UAF30
MPPKKTKTAPVDGEAAPAKRGGGGLTKPLNLSPELAAIIAKEKGEQISRAECVKRLWAYLKEHKLQDPDNKQFFTPDKKMEPVFGSEKIRAFSMSKFLKDHLSNP